MGRFPSSLSWLDLSDQQVQKELASHPHAAIRKDASSSWQDSTTGKTVALPSFPKGYCIYTWVSPPGQWECQPGDVHCVSPNLPVIPKPSTAPMPNGMQITLSCS